ncbi:protein of unknown function [Taphrina deformans PYCC 5710]|uniref:Uncharacterized protein n=1 Tax=Taphrina deformans (strain PYCC 5710 / ATCC 11124 / CBS 356.35 / IMI 108563 / JCM 9778 / NBRC 8474) TaxID=1097556 RepID=R4XBI8_TAPDE|nr:protein of unknown function [Taphrina deformans PYCC 5710]|eukprot:CCG83143.1 protein of unknown function [Taphrina deformans PYCC 5710]
MPDDDDFDFSKYVLRLSKKIAQLTKDYVGLPFSTSANQLPFSIENRPQARSKYYGTTKKWQKGDPIIGYSTDAPGNRNLINLPDGSSLLDLCYPGWEVAILDQSALNHFFQKRYLFGDYYAHLLTGRPLRKPRQATGIDITVDGAANSARAETLPRGEEIFKRRRTTLQQAAEQQQRRGVPFDARMTEHTSTVSQFSNIADMNTPHDTDLQDSSQEKQQSGMRIVEQVTLGTRFVRDASSGISDNRLVIQKRYSTGEVETIEKRSQNRFNGSVDNELEKLLSSELFSVFAPVSTEEHKEVKTERSPEPRASTQA